MLKVDRQKEILELLYRNGSVKVPELCQKYNVRDETIRRDLKALAAKWNIKIIYGGAYVNNPSEIHGVKELAMAAKRQENYEAKQIIAKKAAALIEDGDTIGLNNGSTVEYILDYIEDKRVSIVTLNVHVAAKALLLPQAEVYVPGGKIRNSSGMVTGPGSLDFIKSLSIDKCFFGISAMSIQRGIMHPVIEEVEANVALLKISKHTYLTTDSSKLNKTAFFIMASLDDFENVIIDNDFPQDYKDYLTLRNIRIL